MLDKNSPTPLYVQFEESVRHKIDNEEWPLNSMIPSENELSRTYGISRMTVRSVLNRLVMAGLLYRVPGKGTYVSEAKIESSPLSWMGIREQLERMGYETETKLLTAELVSTSTRIAKLLEIKPGATAYLVKRIRYVKGVPLSVHTSYIPQEVSPDLERQDLEGKQLCDILTDEYNCRIARQVETLESITASAEEAELLGVSTSFPLLLLENRVYNSNQVPIEYSKVVFRGDKIKLRLEHGQNGNG
jgi:GntR family transcriptional regulator